MTKAEIKKEPASSDYSITPEMLEEFKELYHKEFDVKLSDGDAYNKAFNFLNLFEAIYHPIPVEHKAALSAPETVDSSGGRSPVTRNDGRQLKLF